MVEKPKLSITVALVGILNPLLSAVQRNKQARPISSKSALLTANLKWGN